MAVGYLPRCYLCDVAMRICTWNSQSPWWKKLVMEMFYLQATGHAANNASSHACLNPLHNESLKKSLSFQPYTARSMFTPMCLERLSKIWCVLEPNNLQVQSVRWVLSSLITFRVWISGAQKPRAVTYIVVLPYASIPKKWRKEEWDAYL